MTTCLELLPYIVIFLFGIILGSFLNVCICRIPLGESVAGPRSHCMNCGYQLAWYDLVPLFSYLFLRGRCRRCHTHVSLQYPLVEASNGILYLWIFAVHGYQWVSLIYCAMASALLTLSVIDARTREIPFGINIFLALTGLVRLALDYQHWYLYVIGAVCVSGFLGILYLCSKGRAIGGGDIKLMGACGLILGWKLILLAFFAGCVLASVIHLFRMWFSGAERVLAMGPYLSAGIFLSALYGGNIIQWYLSLLG